METNHFIVLYRAYDLQLSDAMNDLQEQVKVEHAPTDKNEHGVEVSLYDMLGANIISTIKNGELA